MNSKVTGFQATDKFLPTVRLSKNLKTRKGSRRGNSGNYLELQNHRSAPRLTRTDTFSHSFITNFKMVQGGSQAYITKTPCGDWDNSSRKEGFQALQKKEQDRKEAQKQQEKEKSKYGAWGPTFKNRDHFINLHHC